MPTIAQVLKAEVSRIARRELRMSLVRSRKEIATLRRGLADLRSRFLASESDRKTLAKTLKSSGIAAAPDSKAAPDGGWFSSKGIRSLRKRLKLTQRAFARLSGVTAQAVYAWERGGARGKLRLRRQTAVALAGLRDLGTKEAKARLAALPKPSAARRPKRSKTRRASARKGT
jgi:DNA-binding transcriptional regulator YiaG